MTWFSYNNLGSQLQAFALYSILVSLGHEVSIINYVPKKTEKKTLINQIKTNPRLLISNSLSIIDNKLKNLLIKNSTNEKFNTFREKKFNFTRNCESLSDFHMLNDEYDFFISGSDQIWSPLVYDSKYFLDFVLDDNKKIAYAPSIGSNTIENDTLKKAYKNHLKTFASLSVREEKGCEIIENLIGKKPFVALDPTLLLNKKEWNNYTKNIIRQDKPQKYILCYFLGKNSKHWKIVKHFSTKYNIPVKIIPQYFVDYYKSFENIDGVGPEEFLDLIRNAKYICTDSFHGLLFSIIYHKPFFAFKRFKDNDSNCQNSRVYNILTKLNLNHRLIDSFKAIDKIIGSDIDYITVEKKLSILRDQSLSFLTNSLVKSKKFRKITSVEKMICTGCSACKEVCQVNAITIAINPKGFFEKKVKIASCINCGSCLEVCPGYGSIDLEKFLNNKVLYSGYSTNYNDLKLSSSGGVSNVLSKYFHRINYDIFGCVYSSQEKLAKTIKVNNVNEIQGSKYLQSDMRSVWKDLKKSKKGVFFGTPCQVAAVHKFLNQSHKRNNFYLIDLICHGVPSYFLWDSYLKLNINRMGNYPNITFRNNLHNWYNRTIQTKDLKFQKKAKNDIFYKFFNSELCYAESCYECRFRNSSYADLRIGDFWGPKFKNNKTGVSMIISLTQKGQELINILKNLNDFTISKEEIEDYYKNQQSKNIMISLSYYDLIEELKIGEKSLYELYYAFVKEKELDKKIKKNILKIVRFCN